MATPSLTALTGVATRQHGVISTLQLHRLGLTHEAIRHRLSTGLLVRIHRGVYVVGTTNLTRYGQLAAALLACGTGAILSHRSAAFLWALLPWIDEPADVTTPGRQSRSRSGIRVHRCTTFNARDIRKRHGLAVTSPSLTVLDLATVDPVLAGEAWNEALLHRLSSESEMAGLLDRRPGHRGVGAMRRLLVESGGGFSRQEAERMLHRLIREAELPTPLRNARVHGHELDFWWPAARLNVEMDGYRWHSTRARLNRDRERDAELTARGVRVLRFSYDQLRRPNRVVAQLAAAIAIAAGQ